MRHFLPLLFCAVLVAEEQRQFDPSKPADALAIVAQVCAQSQMKVADAQVVIVALQTLNAVVHPPAPAAPVEAPKPEGTKP